MAITIPIKPPLRYSTDTFPEFGIVDTFLDTRSIDSHVWAPEVTVEWQVSECVTPENHIVEDTCLLPENKSAPDYVFKGLEQATPKWLEKSVFVSAECRDVDLRKEAERAFLPNFNQEIETDFGNPLFLAAGPATLTLHPLDAFLQSVRLSQADYNPQGLVILIDAVVEGHARNAGLIREETGPHGRPILKDVWGNTIVRTQWFTPPQAVIALTDPQIAIYLSEYIELSPPENLLALTNTRQITLERGFIISASWCQARRVDYCNSGCTPVV